MSTERKPGSSRPISALAATLGALVLATSLTTLSPGLVLAASASAAIPPAERWLDAHTATQKATASARGISLEGAIMDGRGNLLFCNVEGRAVLRMDKSGAVTKVLDVPGYNPGGLALDPKGRLHVAAIDMVGDKGAIFAANPDGTLEEVVGPENGFWPNDLVFDAKGGMYFTDFRGSLTKPTGGVYYCEPDGRIVSVISVAQGNGLGLSPDGRVLWVTDFARGELLRLELATPTTFTPIGTNVVWHFTGPAPDSLRVDRDGNVYVAVYGQGRVLVFSPMGIPVAQVLLPGREEGRNLLCTSLALRQDAKEMYVVSGNPQGSPHGAHVFGAPSLAEGLPR